jgi:hypothetical protein
MNVDFYTSSMILHVRAPDPGGPPHHKSINEVDLSQSIMPSLQKLPSLLPDLSTNPWKLSFIATLSNSDKEQIMVHKRGFIYPSDKEKMVSIVVPLPLDTQTSWGLPEDQLERGRQYPFDESKFLLLDMDFAKFSSLQDFVTDCTKRGISAILRHGLTLGGQKIKLVDDLFA